MISAVFDRDAFLKKQRTALQMVFSATAGLVHWLIWWFHFLHHTTPGSFFFFCESPVGGLEGWLDLKITRVDRQKWGFSMSRSYTKKIAPLWVEERPLLAIFWVETPRRKLRPRARLFFCIRSSFRGSTFAADGLGLLSA